MTIHQLQRAAIYALIWANFLCVKIYDYGNMLIIHRNLAQIEVPDKGQFPMCEKPHGDTDMPRTINDTQRRRCDIPRTIQNTEFVDFHT